MRTSPTWNASTETKIETKVNSTNLTERIKDIIDISRENWDESIIHTTNGREELITHGEHKDMLIHMEVSQRASSGPHRGNEVSTHEILSELHSIDPAASTAELVSQLGCTKSELIRKLKKLEDSNQIGSRTSGETTLWWVKDTDQDLLKGFGSFAQSEIPQMMRKEREQARENWKND